jgi:dienelactone hydrolase
MSHAIRSGQLLCIAVLSLLAPIPSTAGGPLPPARSVMSYLGMRANCLAARLPPVPDDPAKWAARRQVVRGELAAILGLPPREPMRAKVLSSHIEDGVVVEDVMYLWAERAYVSARVVRPLRVTGPLPALVEPPGWLGRFEYDDGAKPYRPFVFQMAKKGYLVIFVDDPHVGKRTAPCAGLYCAASAAGIPVMGIQVFDTLRALDYLLTRPDVDPGRIGVAGLCQGSEQTWLAAALDDRFQIAVPVCGTTSYEAWARMATGGRALSDPSPYVADVLRHTDWHEIAACIAPQPIYVASNSGDDWWPRDGYDKVLATLRRTFAMYGASASLMQVRDLRSHSMTPFIGELSPWIDEHLQARPARADVSRAPVGEPVDPDFSMLNHIQRRLARQTEPLAGVLRDRSAWQEYRRGLVQWLADACRVEEMRPGPPITVSRCTEGKLAVESVFLRQDEDLFLPVTVYCSPAGAAARPAVVLSHDGQFSMNDPALVTMARTLAEDGYVVCVAEHASTQAAGLQRIDNLNSFYGIGDMVALPPLALRVWDDLRAVEYLAGRDDIDRRRIVLIGLGMGGIDAAMAATLDARVAGVAAVGATTVGDWAQEVAPKMDPFDRIYPVLPNMALHTDLQYIYSDVAPRPLLLVEAADAAEWPPAAFGRVRNTAQRVYQLQDASRSLQAARPVTPNGLEEIRRWLSTCGFVARTCDPKAAQSAEKR